MEDPKLMLDPTNGARCFIFGDIRHSECWIYDSISQTPKQLANGVPVERGWNGYKDKLDYECASFEIEEHGKTSTYGLLYGGRARYSIYEFETNTWNKNACILQEKWKKDTILCDYSTDGYGFSEELSMTTDLFNKNTIHIIGDRRSSYKYGYMKFDFETLNDPNLGFMYSFSHFYVFDTSSVRIDNSMFLLHVFHNSSSAIYTWT